MIGIFDSGSGGLTVLKAIRERLPAADIVYFGDIRNAPYGEKSNKELSLLTIRAIELLQSRGAESIVSACNSVSASLAISLFDALSIAPGRLIEMVGPTVSSFKDSSARLLLTATPATIQSEIYQNAFHMIEKGVETVAIPELAGAIEFGASDKEIESIIRDVFIDVPMKSYDLLILACTHYPLVAPIFEKVLGAMPLFNPAVAVGERVRQEMASLETGEGSTHFIISKDSEPFRGRVGALLPKGAYTLEVLE